MNPLWVNAAEISTFKYENEEYAMVTYFFHTPPAAFEKRDGYQTLRPPIQYLPVATVLIPLKAYKDITKRFLGHLARREEPKRGGGNGSDVV